MASPQRNTHHFFSSCVLFSFLVFLYLFGSVGLSCGSQDLHCILQDLFVEVHRLSSCGTQAPEHMAKKLWLAGLVAPQHVGS